MNRLGQRVSLGACALCEGFASVVTHVWIVELADAMSRIVTPSSYAKSTERQAELATGEVFNCYRSSHCPIPLALLYPFFDTFCWSASDTADLQQRDMLFTLEVCKEMRGFAGTHRLAGQSTLRHWFVTIFKASCQESSSTKYAEQASLTFNFRFRYVHHAAL